MPIAERLVNCGMTKRRSMTFVTTVAASAIASVVPRSTTNGGRS